MNKRITILQGHPDSKSNHFGHALSESYAQAAEKAGFEVRRVDIGKLDFQLIKSKFQWEKSSLPMELRQAQRNLLWADHWVLFYPLWLGAMPAVLKGFLEQVLRPGLAHIDTEPGEKWEKLLAGRSARIVVTMATPAVAYRLFYGAHTVKSLERNILKYCGFDPVRTTLIGGVYRKSPKQREKVIEKMHNLGTLGA